MSEMGNVVEIRPAILQPDAEVVASLKSLLIDAEAGRIRGFAFVGLASEQCVRWDVAGQEAKCNYLRLHGLLAWLQKQMLSRWEERA